MLEKEMDTSTTIGVIGTLIGLSGLFYGIWKDSQIRKIEKRGKGPHFVPVAILIDAAGASQAAGKPPVYYYDNTPRKLGERLWETTFCAGFIPEDYPENRVAGIRVKNEGARIRYFTISSKENISVKDSEDYGDCLDIQYLYKNNERGKEFRFRFHYENDAGFKGKQIWAVTKGLGKVRRIHPK
jgi:hypothetical protein